MTTETITIKTKAELKAMTAENTVFNANTSSHANKCKRIGKALLDEYERIKDIAKDERERLENDGNKTVSFDTRQRTGFSDEEYIRKYGKDDYDEMMRKRAECMIKTDVVYIEFN